jgi:hypothetical protein
MIGQTVAQSDDDALIESLIMQETDFIQNFCCREFFYNTYTEYIDGDGGDHIFVGESPIASVTSVHDDVDRVYGANTLIPVTDYFVDTNNGIIKLTDSVTDEAYGNVKVIYLGGFKVIPKDLELACCQRVYADYLELKGGVNVLEGETVTYKPSNLRKQAQEVIDRYKRIR